MIKCPTRGNPPIPVDSPQLDIACSLDSGSPGSAIDQGKLSETAAFADAQDLFAPDVDLDLTLVDDVEVVALVALLDDDLAGHRVGGEHGVEDVAALVLVEVAEQDVLGDCLGQGGHRLVVLWHNLEKVMFKPKLKLYEHNFTVCHKQFEDGDLISMFWDQSVQGARNISGID